METSMGQLFSTRSGSEPSAASDSGEGFGTIFKITPAGQLTTLYSFCPKGEPCIDSQYPTSLTLGADGTIYGTTFGPQLGGSFFKITPTGMLTTLNGFGRGQTTQGSNPVGPLIQASDGNFYGTASSEGIMPCGSFSPGCGTVFKITPGGVLTKLYTFGTTPTYGANPRSALVLATDGNFYGTTIAGGATGDGTVFRITPSGALTTLYSFTHGAVPPATWFKQGTEVCTAPTVAAPVVTGRHHLPNRVGWHFHDAVRFLRSAKLQRWTRTHLADSRIRWKFVRHHSGWRRQRRWRHFQVSSGFGELAGDSCERRSSQRCELSTGCSSWILDHDRRKESVIED